jgi:hypothetical protein
MSPAVNVGEPEDWYALLGLSPTATAEQIAVVVDRLATLADAESATAPERSRDLYLQINAIRADLLSGPDRRRRYDEMLAYREWAAATRPPQAAGSMSPLPMPASGPPQAGQPYPVPPQAPESWMLAPAPVPARGSDAATEAQPASGARTWADPDARGDAQAGTGAQAGDADSAPGRPGFAGPGPDARWQAGPTAHQAVTSSHAGRTMARLRHFLQTAWTCPACGHGALPADKFCQKCGARVPPPRWSVAADVPHSRSPISPPVLCVSCGSRISAGNMYCTQCGARRP